MEQTLCMTKTLRLQDPNKMGNKLDNLKRSQDIENEVDESRRPQQKDQFEPMEISPLIESKFILVDVFGRIDVRPAIRSIPHLRSTWKLFVATQEIWKRDAEQVG